MSVKTEPQDILISIASAETRFDDGYRYLDKCGSAISQIRQKDEKWVPAQMAPQGTVLVNEAAGLQLQMTQERLALVKNSEDSISHLDGENLVKAIAERINSLYAIIVATFDIPNTIRVGARFNFSAPASSLEDAQMFVAARTRGPLRQKVESAFSSKVFSGLLRYEIEDEETGVRRIAMITTTAKRKGLKTRVTGFDLTDFKDAAVTVDIDAYTRPTDGHYDDVGEFVRTSFATAWQGALSILRSTPI